MQILFICLQQPFVTRGRFYKLFLCFTKGKYIIYIYLTKNAYINIIYLVRKITKLKFVFLSY